MIQNTMKDIEQQEAYFKEKKEESRKLYWDACVFPRKKKKKVRKIAKSDFELYHILSQPLF
jgi:hypothetical protein